MFVWGGTDGTPMNTGGRYDPGTDTWFSSTTVAAPQARYDHTAVFAGEKAIVWGGSAGGGGFATGGRYCVCRSATFFKDADGDGRGDPSQSASFCAAPPGYVSNSADCDDADASVWGTPGEVQGLILGDNVSLSWSAPSDPGTLSPLYDAIRSASPVDFGTSATCVATDSASPGATDPAAPPSGGIFFYLIRAQSACANGQGPLGYDSNGTLRSGRSCP